MELNLNEKFDKVYNQTNLNIEKVKPYSKDISFHIDCKYSRKKICYCKFYENKMTQSAKNEKEFSDFLIGLIKDEITLDTSVLNSNCPLSNKKINFISKDPKLVKHYQDQLNIQSERIKNIEYTKLKHFMKTS